MELVALVTGGLSQTLQATPLFRTLREGLPEARLTLAIPRPAAELASGLPACHEVLVLGALGGTCNPAAQLRAWLSLRRRRIDAAVLCSSSPAARALVYWAGIPRRIGPAGGASTILLSEHVRRGPAENDAACWLRLAGLLGVGQLVHSASFSPDPSARASVEQRLLGGGFEDGRILVAMAPGAGVLEPRAAAAGELWPQDRYAHLANQLAARHGAAVILLGAPGDRRLIDALLVDLDAMVLDLCGELSLHEIAAVVARCDLLVAGHSPLLHLAAAVGTPAIGLFGGADGHRLGPYGPGQRVIQGLDGAGSPLDRIRVEDVLAGIEATL